MDQANSGIRSSVIEEGRMLMIVEIKLIEAIMEETPAK